MIGTGLSMDKDFLGKKKYDLKINTIEKELTA